MLIKDENTPNPNAVKFVCFRPISPTESKTFLIQEDCRESSLANKLLLIDDVEIVFFGNDFITLTKKESAHWESIKPKAILTIIDHFSLTNKAFDRKAKEEEVSQTSTNQLGNDSIDGQIRQVLDEYVRPAIAMDGGDLVYHGFQDGVVTITLVGACRGCPSSAMTLKHGIQTTLQYHVPEVISVALASIVDQ
jgi:Fe-S cluster biogenesis protein NfuA